MICSLFKMNRQNCDCPRNKIKTHFWIKYAKNIRLDRENHQGILGIFSLWQYMTTATPRAWDLNFGRPIRSENGFIAVHRRYIGARRLYFRTWARGVWNTRPPALQAELWGATIFRILHRLLQMIDKASRDEQSHMIHAPRVSFGY